MKRFSITTPFLDILFNILLGFFVLLMLTILVVNPPTKSGDTDLKAEILISMEWPDESEDDVDLFVKTPASDIPVFFGNRDIKVASLDRDDLGRRSDKLVMDDGTVHEVFENWENVAIRKMIAGEYIVNVVMYNKNDKRPTPVILKAEKLNPYRLIFSGTIVLDYEQQEETAVSFTLDSNGKILERSTAHKSMLNIMRGNY